MSLENLQKYTLLNSVNKEELAELEESSKLCPSRILQSIPSQVQRIMNKSSPSYAHTKMREPDKRQNANEVLKIRFIHMKSFNYKVKAHSLHQVKYLS